MVFSINNYQPSSVDVLATFFFEALFYIGYAFYRIRKKHDKKYPPFAPGGWWEHLKMATNSQYPWWLLVRLLFINKSNVFHAYSHMLHNLFLLEGCIKATSRHSSVPTTISCSTPVTLLRCWRSKCCTHNNNRSIINKARII